MTCLVLVKSLQVTSSQCYLSAISQSLAVSEDVSLLEVPKDASLSHMLGRSCPGLHDLTSRRSKSCLLRSSVGKLDCFLPLLTLYLPPSSAIDCVIKTNLDLSIKSITLTDNTWRLKVPELYVCWVFLSRQRIVQDWS